MTKMLMTGGPMQGQVLDIQDEDEVARVLDREMGVLHVEDEDKPKPDKSTRTQRVQQKRKVERAVAPVETPEGV